MLPVPHLLFLPSEPHKNVLLYLLHRITGISQIYKIDSFDHAAVIDIQTWNNSFGKHYARPPSTPAKFFKICNPTVLLFSGWNWQANRLPFSTEAWMQVL